MDVSTLSSVSSSSEAADTLQSVLCTKELERRPSRAPDYRAENQALVTLSQALTHSPGSVLQSLVNMALKLCRAHSAGISLLEEEGPPGSLSARGDHFRWHAVAGQWAPLVWDTTTPRGDSPCGTVLDRNNTLLFCNAHCYYTQFAGVRPLPVEALLVPFHVVDQAVGTVWVVAHDETRQFDAEDKRLLESLAIFAAMAYQVRLSIAAQVKANEELQARIAERLRAEDALREADRNKSEFLAMLAHELRNPLAPVRNALEILRRSGDDQQNVKPVIQMMERQVAQMVRLVDDLLDMSRISRNKMELRKNAIELASVVHQAVEAARPLCASMAHELIVTLPPEPIYVKADAGRLAQVVGNLLNNACKFTEKGGRIQLTVGREDDQAVIRVQDTGIGIAREHLPDIFDMFVQGDTSLERARDGLGVGLTLVKTLVELHDGTVEANSAGVGKGSEFVVRLPLVSAARPTSPQAPVVKPVAMPVRRILVVDDNKDSADSLATLLKLMGHEVHTAHDGVEAVDTAAQVEPEVILLDIGLPRLNGYEAARRIREQRRTGSTLTLVALSGWGQEEDRRRSEAAGFDAHLVKPVDLDALSNLLAGSDKGEQRRN
jgi:signal transduction histidine kinase/ActR/RegA family two-component response regulator